MADTEDAPDFPTGGRDTWGALSEIGSGAFGVVYASGARPGVAVKRMLPAHSDEDVVGRAAREYALGFLARGPCVVAHLEHIGRDLVLELCAPAPRPVRADSVLAALRDMLTGLSSIHRAGIVHGDIKPENVMYSGGRLKIIDFSSSFTADEGRGLYMRGGAHTITITHRPPELAAGYPHLEPSADVYAGALTLLEFRAPAGHLVPVSSNDDSCARLLYGIENTLGPMDPPEGSMLAGALHVLWDNSHRILPSSRHLLGLARPDCALSGADLVRSRLLDLPNGCRRRVRRLVWDMLNPGDHTARPSSEQALAVMESWFAPAPPAAPAHA